jgi:hypothetical protein
MLPNGLSDWMGDSARRAVRAAEYCESKTSPTEILVDEAVQKAVERDFQMERVDMTKRVPAKPSEEELSLWQLIDLKPKTYSQLEDPPQFFYTACMIGRVKEVEKIVERFIDQASEVTDREKRGRTSIDLDILIRSLPSPVHAKCRLARTPKKLNNACTQLPRRCVSGDTLFSHDWA